MKFVIPVVFLFVSLFIKLPSLSAQSFHGALIRGTVVDVQHAPVPNAVVVLRRAADSVVYKTSLTDTQGKFTFEAIKDGIYLAEINIIGYERWLQKPLPADVSHPETDLGLVILKQRSEQLKGVEVKSQVPFIERQIDKTVVNIENSIISEGSTALEVLQRLPGVQVDQGGQVTLNGRSAVSIFMDGKAVQLSAEDLNNLLRGMPSSMVQKVEIMTKPSARYDAAGSGGIINIVRKRNRKEGLSGSVNGGFGQAHYAKYNAGANLNYKNKNYNLSLSLAYLHNTDFYTTSITSDVLNPDLSLKNRQKTENRNARASNAYTPQLGAELYLSARTTLSLSATGGFQFANNRVNSTLKEENGAHLKTGNLLFDNDIRDKPFNYGTGMHLVHQIDTSGQEFSLDFDYLHYWSKSHQDINSTTLDTSWNFMKDNNDVLEQDRKLNIYAVKGDYVLPLKGHARLEAGFKSSYVKVNNDNSYYHVIGSAHKFDSLNSNYIINQENINAVYVNVNKEYRNVTVQAGLRAEHTWNSGEQRPDGELVRRNYVQLFPSLFLDYKISKDHALNVKVGRRTDRPAYSQMNPFRRPLSPTLYFQGNPYLQPQTSVNTEITYSWRNELFLTFAYDFYHNYMATLPYLDSNQVTVTRIPTNVNGSHSWNIDIVYSRKVVDWWTVNCDFTLYRQTFGGSVDHFSLDNNGVLSFNADVNNNFSITSRLSAECSFHAVSQRRMVATTYGGYYIVSAGIKQLVFGSHGSISAKVTNILQTEDEGSSYVYEHLNQNWQINFFSRAASVNFTYRFGNGKTTKLRSSGASEEQRRSN